MMVFMVMKSWSGMFWRLVIRTYRESMSLIVPRFTEAIRPFVDVEHLTIDGDAPCDDELLYEDPFLARRDPGEVGDVVEEDMGDGTTQTVITRAVNPPIFELPNFLSDEECEHIRTAAKNKVKESKVVGLAGPIKHEKTRISKTTFLSGGDDEVLKGILNRASILTGLSKKLVYDAEKFQVGYYGVGGFYNFHTDSTLTHEATRFERPCCDKYSKTSTSRCTVCRYVTILMYLNDVEEGGETAFPLADTHGQTMPNDYEFLELLCENAPVVVSPVKGNAVMWYNNIVDPEHGWLGPVDEKSVHGGCPVIKGEKWVSNLWINAPPYNALTKQSKYL